MLVCYDSVLQMSGKKCLSSICTGFCLIHVAFLQLNAWLTIWKMLDLDWQMNLWRSLLVTREREGNQEQEESTLLNGSFDDEVIIKESYQDGMNVEFNQRQTVYKECMNLTKPHRGVLNTLQTINVSLDRFSTRNRETQSPDETHIVASETKKGSGHSEDVCVSGENATTGSKNNKDNQVDSYLDNFKGDEDEICENGKRGDQELKSEKRAVNICDEMGPNRKYNDAFEVDRGERKEMEKDKISNDKNQGLRKGLGGEKNTNEQAQFGTDTKVLRREREIDTIKADEFEYIESQNNAFAENKRDFNAQDLIDNKIQAEYKIESAIDNDSKKVTPEIEQSLQIENSDTNSSEAGQNSAVIEQFQRTESINDGQDGNPGTDVVDGFGNNILRENKENNNTEKEVKSKEGLETTCVEKTLAKNYVPTKDTDHEGNASLKRSTLENTYTHFDGNNLEKDILNIENPTNDINKSAKGNQDCKIISDIQRTEKGFTCVKRGEIYDTKILPQQIAAIAYEKGVVEKQHQIENRQDSLWTKPVVNSEIFIVGEGGVDTFLKKDGSFDNDEMVETGRLRTQAHLVEENIDNGREGDILQTQRSWNHCEQVLETLNGEKETKSTQTHNDKESTISEITKAVFEHKNEDEGAYHVRKNGPITNIKIPEIFESNVDTGRANYLVIKWANYVESIITRGNPIQGNRRIPEFRGKQRKADATQVTAEININARFTAEQKKTISEMTKMCALKFEQEKKISEVIAQKVAFDIHNNYLPNETIMAFIKKCAELCWYMAIQEPPVVIGFEDITGDVPFNKDKYKAYTKTGKTLDYIVWPPLYLYEGGSMLCKGTAQGKS